MKYVYSIAWLVLACSIGCGKSSGADDEPKRRESLVEALTRAVKWERGQAQDDGIVDLGDGVGGVTVDPDGSAIDLGPDAASVMGFEVDNLEDDEVVATVLQFEGADGHTRVPVEMSDAGDAGGTGAGAAKHVENPFRVESDVCEYLCNRIYNTRLVFAAVLSGRKITRQKTIQVELDCREDGDPDLCEGEDEDEPEPDASDDDPSELDASDDDPNDMDASDDDPNDVDASDDPNQTPDSSTIGDGSVPEGTQPVVSLLTPATIPAGEGATLSIDGSGFTDSAQAYLDGMPLPTTVVSESLIEVEVPATATAGSLAVVVENIEGDETTRSNVLYVQVTPAVGAPVVYDYSPDNGVAGDTILIIASGLAGQDLTIEDADGNELEPGALSTISWPTAGAVDTVEVILPDDIVTGPITVSSPLGSYRGKIFSVGLNLTRAQGTVVESSSEFNTSNWSRASGADNLLATSFFTAVGDCASLDTCTMVPVYTITLASNQLVERIAMRGNREYATGYDFIRGRFELLDANGDPVWEGVYDLPAPDRDLDITLVDPVRARALRFESLEDESSEPGFAELEMFGP